MGRREGESRTGRGGRQAGDVDVVLNGEGHAPERQAVGLGCAAQQRFRLGAQGRPVDGRDEHSRIGLSHADGESFHRGDG